MSNNYILALPSWYPNNLSPYDGDFIQRHIKAIGLFKKQIIVYVKKDESGKYTNDYIINTHIENNVTEIIIYYKPIQLGIPFLNQIFSHLKYLSLFKKQIKKIIEENGLPQFIHVHIAYKSGIIANWIKRKWSIPYIITENSTIYLNEAIPNLRRMSFFYRQTTKKTLRASLGITAVSTYLENAIKNYTLNHNFFSTPNVVNTSVFSTGIETYRDSNQFVFISNFTYQKNFPFLVAAITHLKEQNIKLAIHCYGSYTSDAVDLVAKSNLSDFFIFYGEVSQDNIAKKMKEVSALLICSKYETFGCVVIEANAVGLPVLATPTKPFDELIENGVNGIIAKEFTVESYANVIKCFIENKYNFDGKRISEMANKYSYEKIGKQFDDIYKQLTK